MLVLARVWVNVCYSEPLCGMVCRNGPYILKCACFGHVLGEPFATVNMCCLEFVGKFLHIKTGLVLAKVWVNICYSVVWLVGKVPTYESVLVLG